MFQSEILTLPAYNAGTSRFIRIYRFGDPGSRPKVYIQAGVHADERPANLTALHLAGQLAKLDADGAIAGEIILIPVANPIGTDNVQAGYHLGRFHGPSGQNFNRHWPQVSDTVSLNAKDQLGSDSDVNRAVIHKLTADALADIRPANEAEALRLMLMTLAHDADIVLDLHTDADAELHLYIDPDKWPDGQDLAGLLDAKVVMLARDSGDAPFEETIALPFIATRSIAADAMPVPQPLTVVVELRGQLDVSDELALKDAGALIKFLQNRGAIGGDPGDIPAFTGVVGSFEATDVITAPGPGIIVFKRGLGDMVQAGDVIAEIADPMADPSAPRAEVKTCTDGRLFTRTLQPTAWTGCQIAKVQGTEPLGHRKTGKLLSD